MTSKVLDTESGKIIGSKKYRAVQFSINGRDNLKDTLLIAWGMDAWFGNVPFFKTIAFLNGIVWGLMWFFGG